MKFRNHPNVTAIRNAFNPQSFNFSKGSVDDVLRELTNYAIERQYTALRFL